MIIKAVGMRAYWCSYGIYGEEWGDDINSARIFATRVAAEKFLSNWRPMYECEIIPTIYEA